MLARVMLSEAHLGTVWSSLHDSGITENLNASQCLYIKQAMYNISKKLLKEQQKTDLLELSKALIDTIVPVIKEQKSSVRVQNAPVQELPQEFPDSIDATAGTLKQQNREVFDIELQQRRKEFENLVTNKIPEQPEFEDEKDEQLDSRDIGQLLKIIEEERKQSLTNL